MTRTGDINAKNHPGMGAIPHAEGVAFRYLIHGPKGPVSRIDPYAIMVTNATGNGIIYDPKARKEPRGSPVRAKSVSGHTRW